MCETPPTKLSGYPADAESGLKFPASDAENAQAAVRNLGKVDVPNVMLTYGGGAGGMGKPGSFDFDKEWFGFKKDYLNAHKFANSDAVFADMQVESSKMRAAIAAPGRFPVPQYKQQGIDKPQHSELEEIARLDELMTEPNKPDKVPEIEKLMQPSDAASYESGGAPCYIYGPFSDKEELLATLRNDPMLQPVYNKWSKFETSVLDAATQRGTLYLQVRWQGWFVRPVLEMTKEQLASLLEKARAFHAIKEFAENLVQVMQHTFPGMYGSTTCGGDAKAFPRELERHIEGLLREFERHIEGLTAANVLLANSTEICYQIKDIVMAAYACKRWPGEEEYKDDYAMATNKRPKQVSEKLWLDFLEATSPKSAWKDAETAKMLSNSIQEFLQCLSEEHGKGGMQLEPLLFCQGC